MATPPDVTPIRPGAAPDLNVVLADLVGRLDHQPVWSYMTQKLVKWFRYHFSLAARIELPDLADRVWLPDQEKSPIKITSLAEWTPLAADQRPAILVDRLDQDLDQKTAGIGERLMGGAPGFRYAHFVAGSHVVHCLGGREGEADNLANEIWRECSRFAHVFREAMCLYRFRAVKVGKRAQITETDGKQHYSTPVLLTYYYEESWKVTPLDEAAVAAILI